MKNILVSIPSYCKGNIGDAALVKTLKNIYKNHNLIIPSSIKKLNSSDVSKIDFFIYFGNDCILTSSIFESIIEKVLNSNKKVHVINTSWGNNPKEKCVNFLKKISSNSNFQIYMRDKFSHELIQKDINFYNKPILTADLAFLCKKDENTKIQKLEDWINKNDKHIIGINIHKDFKEYNSNVRTEVKKFITTNKNKYRFLFIPHDSRKKEYKDLQDLCKSCSGIDGYTTNYLNPEYEKYITSKLFLVITGRMHLSILTIPNSVPAIAIAYNGIKAKGTFEHWGLDELVIEPKNIDKLTDLVCYVCTNYKNIQNKINNNKDNVNNLVNKQILNH